MSINRIPRLSIQPDERFIFVDTETFGLVPVDCPIIEVGILVVDRDFTEVSSFDVLIWEHGLYDSIYDRLVTESSYSTSAKVVLEMHKKSGLWERAKANGVGIAQAEDDLVEYCLRSLEMKSLDPMVGSSIHFDRQMLKFHMPRLETLFSYRNIDVSTVKELCRRINPSLYSLREENLAPVAAHRALSDCRDSATELAFYAQSFLGRFTAR